MEQLGFCVKVSSTVTESKSHRAPLGCGVAFVQSTQGPSLRELLSWISMRKKEKGSKKCILGGYDR